ncbi:MAG TPA: hypothetical protein VJN92_14290 [Candidatus Acidoferrum sp.]|nr:hypothetical protein [Candidatus Acidoferrum sp.]
MTRLETDSLRQTLGLALGLPLSLLGGRLIASQLYKTNPYNLAILVDAGLLLLLSALVAGTIPARRAASLDPVRALRAK